MLLASTAEYHKANRYLITVAMKNGKISLDEAAYLSDCQRATLGTFGKKTALMDIQNHASILHDNYSTPVMGLSGGNKSFEVCLKADDVMKKTEVFLRKMQANNPL